MSEPRETDSFHAIVDHFTAAGRNALTQFLNQLAPELAPGEAALFAAAGSQALCESARLKLNRVLLLELHAAKRAGTLDATDDAERFAQFVQQAQTAAFATHLDTRYPTLRPRLQQALQQQGHALQTLATRLVADRAALEALLGQPPGTLRDIRLGLGDLHAGGQSVARLSFDGGEILYKPRSLAIDNALDALLARLFPDDAQRIRVPQVLARQDYGWAAFVSHRYCSDETELRRFYLGLGQWLAVLRLLGGVDIHQENLIAAGPVPVVIDAESLFAPVVAGAVSGNGQAYDLAQNLIYSSVLRTGIVPFRADALGFDGVDVSAAGGLPGQQPQIHMPVIVDAGTTRARLQIIDSDVSASQNHPSATPDVSRYWDQLSDGFLQASAQLRALDGAGTLQPLLLELFQGCTARAIRRATQAYVEIGRMLWHPASLHGEAAAVARARDLLQRNAAVAPLASSDAAEIDGEIADLLVGDIPVFSAALSRERILANLADWRGMREELEELTIRCALVATNLNRRDSDTEHNGRNFFARRPHAQQLETRRRQLAGAAVRRLLHLAVRGDEGTVTWITPETSAAGWLVQPLQTDLYFGLGGVTFALAGYAEEVRQGRADAVAGLDDSLAGALRVLAAMDTNTQPTGIGGFNGLSARIWSWLSLADLLGQAALLQRAETAAARLQQIGFEQDIALDITDGSSGTIVPLLLLAEASGNPRWLELAAQAGRRLETVAIRDDRGARWQTLLFGQPVGGFAHGTVGVAWALARLALSKAGDAADRARWRQLSDQGFAYQDSFYVEALNNWLDQRQFEEETTFHTWCNGSVGMGLAAADLYARTRDPAHLLTLRRAVKASRGQWGISHTLCHGDFSLGELLLRAARLDPEHCACDPQEPAIQIISAIEENRGYVGSLTRAAFTPGLMTGLSGAIHGLNRLHPDCTLPSPLLFERRLPARETAPADSAQRHAELV